MKDDILLAAARLILQFARALIALAILVILLGFALSLLGSDPMFAAIEAELQPEGIVVDGRITMLFVLGIAVLILALAERFLARLVAILSSLPAGDPFRLDNAAHLEAMGWLALAMQMLGFVTTLYSLEAEKVASRLTIDGDFSAEGLVLVLLLFILARVFREGARMRDDLEGTV